MSAPRALAGARAAPVPAPTKAGEPSPPPAPLDLPVVELARELVGWTVAHAGCAGRIVETEAYHDSEPACHAFVGLTPRTAVLFGPPARAYVYRSYGIHALLNVVAEPPGTGAAVLVRALEPLEGVRTMREHRGVQRVEDLCSGPGKLTQALAIGLELNGSDLLEGPIALRPPDRPAPAAPVVASRRVGITKAAELRWRFSEAESRFVSRPRPPLAGGY
jgi:DNA-3-methyladenine glycosylase